VLRVTVGEALEVFDGAGASFEARVEASDESGLSLLLGPARVTAAPRSITVVQGLPKGDKLELVLQKGTELGASAFLPVACERSVVKVDGKEAAKQARWQRIAEEAARQCGRADVPTVASPTGLLEGVRALAAGTKVFVLDESERVVPLSAAFSEVRETGTPVAMVVGPEGGLARGEVEALVALGAVPVTLGRLVLRTETAALAALVVLRHLDGELG
jgi:16S rRNA (uracil1498-N3)-methyltransferase